MRTPGSITALLLLAVALVAQDTVTIVAGSDAKEHDLEPGLFIFHRSGHGDALTVDFTVGGSATEIDDYEVLAPHSITFDNGQSDAYLDITPVDNNANRARTLIITITPNNLAYTTGAQNSAQISIWDADSQLSIASTLPLATPEPATLTGTYPLEVDGRAEWVAQHTGITPPLPRTVTVQIGGDASAGPTAVRGTDYILGVNSKSLADTSADTTDIVAISIPTPEGPPGPGVTRIGVADSGLLAVGDIFMVDPAPNDNGIFVVTSLQAGDATHNPSVNFTPALRTVQTAYGTSALRRLGTQIAPAYNTFGYTTGLSDIYYAAYPILGSTTVRGHRSINLTLVDTPDYLVQSPTSSTAILADTLAISNIAWQANAGQPTTVGSVLVQVNASFPQAIDIPFQVTASGATYGTDFTISGVTKVGNRYLGSVHLATGQTSGTIQIVPNGVGLSAPATLTLALRPSNDYRLAPTGSSQYNATASVTLAPAVMTNLGEVVYLSIARQADGDGYEGDSIVPLANAKFTITLTNESGDPLVGILTSDLTVSYTIGGTAVAGVNYTALSGSASIPAGDHSVDIEATVRNDGVVGADTTLQLTLQPNTGYQLASGKSVASALIKDSSPLISITKTIDPTAGGAAGEFTLVNTHRVANDILVRLTLSGTASAPGDYAAIDVPVRILANEDSHQIPISATLAGANKTIIIQVAADSASPATYKVDSGSPSATATIQAGASPTYVAITKSVDGYEGTTTTPLRDVKARIYIATSIGATSSATAASDLTVGFTLSGTAVAGTNYTDISPHSATILTGHSYVDIIIPVINDGVSSTSKTLNLTLTPASGFQIPSGFNIASATIIDTSPSFTLTKTADPAIGGANGSFSLTNANPINATVTVHLAASGTAVAGLDYDLLPTSVTFPANATTYPIAVVAHAGAASGATVTLQVQADSASPAIYKAGSPSSATATIGGGSGTTTDGQTEWKNSGGGCGAGTAGVLALAGIGIAGFRRRQRRA